MFLDFVQDDEVPGLIPEGLTSDEGFNLLATSFTYTKRTNNENHFNEDLLGIWNFNLWDTNTDFSQ